MNQITTQINDAFALNALAHRAVFVEASDPSVDDEIRIDLDGVATRFTLQLDETGYGCIVEAVTLTAVRFGAEFHIDRNRKAMIAAVVATIRIGMMN